MMHIIILVWKESFDFVSMKQKWEIRDMWETVACCQISSLIIRCDCRISSLVSQQHCGCLLVRTEKSWQGTEPGIAVSSTSPSSPPYLQSFSISLPAFVRPSKPWDTCRVGSALTLHHCTEWFWVGWQSGWFSIHRATLLCTTMNQVSLLCTTLPLCHPAMHVHYALSHSTISLSPQSDPAAGQLRAHCSNLNSTGTLLTFYNILHILLSC